MPLRQQDGRTEMPAENRPAPSRRFELMSLRPGEVLEITTAHSRFWVTRTTLARSLGPSVVHGFAVQTDSTTFGQVTRSPEEQNMDADVNVGKQFHIGLRGHTSEVRSFRVL